MTSDLPKKEEKKGRTLRGVVVSDKMNKTVVVEITRLRKHPKYKKYFKVTKKFKAHDENNAYHIRDKINIQEIRPMSRDKRWIVIGKVLNSKSK